MRCKRCLYWIYDLTFRNAAKGTCDRCLASTGLPAETATTSSLRQVGVVR